MEVSIEGRARGRARGKPKSEEEKPKPIGRGPSAKKSSIRAQPEESNREPDLLSRRREQRQERDEYSTDRRDDRERKSANYSDGRSQLKTRHTPAQGRDILTRHNRLGTETSVDYRHEGRSIQRHDSRREQSDHQHGKGGRHRTPHQAEGFTREHTNENLTTQSEQMKDNLKITVYQGRDSRRLTQHEVEADDEPRRREDRRFPSTRGGKMDRGNFHGMEKIFDKMTVGDGFRGRGRGGARGRERFDQRRKKDPEFDNAHSRPSHLVSKLGDSGTPILLTANYFELERRPDIRLFQYRVIFSLEEDRTFVKKALLRQNQDLLPHYMFDGTLMFCFIELYPTNSDPLVLHSTRLNGDGSQDSCRITIRLIGEVAKAASNYLQLLSIIMRQIMEKLDLELIGRNYFDPYSASLIREYCIEIWPGYITSIRQHEKSILMCAEVTNKIIRTDTVYEQMGIIYNRRPPNYRQAVERALLGSVVMTRYNKKTYRIDGIDWTLNPNSIFDCGGNNKPYYSYYQERYNCIIRDHAQPLLVSRPKDKDRRGGRSGPILLIPELCFMTGLTDEQRSDFRLTSCLSKWTRMIPTERVGTLIKLSDKLHNVEEVRKELEAWNMKFAPKLLELKGRILPPETITLINRTSYCSSEADWTRELQRGLFNPAQINRWILMYPERDEDKCLGFLDTMRKVAPGLGINLGEPRLIVLNGNRAGEYVRELTKVIQDGPEMVMCVVPNDKGDQYAAIKKKCCVEQPVPSQVITVNRVLNKEKGYLYMATKVVTQMACKIGAEPWALEIPFKGAMVVGYDTYHDSTRRGESVGALVASVNDTFTRYFSTVDFHRDRTEMSNKIGVMFLRALCKYREVKHSLPSRIFFYRDGVGEGQVSHVIEHEVNRLKETFRKLSPDYDPKITFVIVSKRIHTRFLTKHVNPVDGGLPEYGNPPSGTIVDDVITLPERYDFFLVSQSVRQGTVNPTSYNVIMDETGFRPDQLQRLTYKLTHLYFNYSGSVRVPAPCQYAHKLAFLTGTALHAEPSEHLSDLLYFL